jgi:hypothetical protein
MKKGNGKSKGNAFERKVAGLLDDWWKVPKNTFWRTVNSGGWRQPGDLAPRILSGVEPMQFPFVVECKFYHTVDFWEVLKEKKTAKLSVWWKQLNKEKLQYSDSNKVCRLLIFKQNFSPICVGFSINEIGRFINCPVDPSIINVLTCIKLTIDNSGERIIITPWKDFTRYYPKEIFIRL